MKQFKKVRVVYQCAWPHCGDSATHSVMEGERVIAYYCDYHAECKIELLNDYASKLEAETR